MRSSKKPLKRKWKKWETINSHKPINDPDLTRSGFFYGRIFTDTVSEKAWDETQRSHSY
jgi:hypothetical protein